MDVQAHKMHDTIYDIDLSTMDTKTVGEVSAECLSSFQFKPAHCCACAHTLGVGLLCKRGVGPMHYCE